MNGDIRNTRPNDASTPVAAQKQPAERQEAPRAPRPKAGGKPSSRVIIGIVIGVLAVIIIALALWWFMGRQQTTQTPGKVAESYRQQLPELKKAVETKPDNVSARRSYAVALYVAGDLKEAKKQYEAAIKLKDDDAVLHNNLGNIYRDLKQYDKAVDEYKAAIAIDAKNQNAYANLANVQLYMLKKPDDAIQTYQQAVKAMPDNDQMKLLLGLAYEQADDKQKAIQTFKGILAKDKKNAAAKANLERLEKEK